MTTTEAQLSDALFPAPASSGSWPPELIARSHEFNGLRWVHVQMINVDNLWDVIVILGHHSLEDVQPLLDHLASTVCAEPPWFPTAIEPQWGWIYDASDLPECPCIEEHRELNAIEIDEGREPSNFTPNDECDDCHVRTAFDESWRFDHDDDTTNAPTYARNISPVMVWRPFA